MEEYTPQEIAKALRLLPEGLDGPPTGAGGRRSGQHLHRLPGH